jgi:hypothetical protein
LKIEIEKVENGYIVVLPKNEYNEVSYEKKIVVQEKEDELNETNILEFQTFNDLVEQLQEIFYVDNSKHNEIGYITGLCSESERWVIHQTMKKSLKNPKNDLGDD